MSAAEDALSFGLVALDMLPAEREYRFDVNGRKWRFDFAWPHYKVACEVEGGTFVQGRHTRGAAFEKDAEKYNEAAIQGWLVLRVTPKMVEDGRSYTLIARALGTRGLDALAAQMKEAHR